METRRVPVPPTIPYMDCMVRTAAFYRLPPRVLPAIHSVEGGAVGDAIADPDGSRDLGVMQINTRWVQPIARRTSMNVAETYRRLRDDACFNIAASGLIMRTYLDETGGDLMRAIGNYHSHTPWLNSSYRLLVLNAAMVMFNPGAARPRAIAPGPHGVQSMTPAQRIAAKTGARAVPGDVARRKGRQVSPPIADPDDRGQDG